MTHLQSIKHLATPALLFTLVFLAGETKGQTAVKVGDPVPSFTLKDQNGQPFSVADYTGKKILVIYFYPKDESAVCTKEACAFRDRYTDFSSKGALVIAINSGTVQSHHSFQQNHQLPFILLSDSNNVVLKQFGVKGSFGITGRETYVVDLHGKIVFAYNSMLHGAKHMEDALAFIEQMQMTK